MIDVKKVEDGRLDVRIVGEPAELMGELESVAMRIITSIGDYYNWDVEGRQVLRRELNKKIKKGLNNDDSND